jgi:cytochrome c-type biogenesis protein CcmH/NrfF
MLKRLLQFTLVTTIAFFMLGAGTPSTRFDKLGHKFMCTCGCAQVLLECNHVGCPDSPALIAALHTQVDSGASDSSIFQAFAATYGPTVLAAPLRGGFDNVAWIVPFAILILGLIGVVVLLRVWRRRHASLPLAIGTPPSPAADALRERIRNETHYGE